MDPEKDILGFLCQLIIHTCKIIHLHRHKYISIDDIHTFVQADVTKHCKHPVNVFLALSSMHTTIFNGLAPAQWYDGP